jgi:hypothetical protein
LENAKKKNAMEREAFDGSTYRNKSVTDDTLTNYLRNIQQTLKTSNLEPEERSILIDNVFEEIAGKEIPVSVDKRCSIVLESLVAQAGLDQLNRYFVPMKGRYASLLTNRNASHVIDRFLEVRSAPPLRIAALRLQYRHCRSIHRKRACC